MLCQIFMLYLILRKQFYLISFGNFCDDFTISRIYCGKFTTTHSIHKFIINKKLQNLFETYIIYRYASYKIIEKYQLTWVYLISTCFVIFSSTMSVFVDSRRAIVSSEYFLDVLSADQHIIRFVNSYKYTRGGILYLPYITSFLDI